MSSGDRISPEMPYTIYRNRPTAENASGTSRGEYLDLDDDFWNIGDLNRSTQRRPGLQTNASEPVTPTYGSQEDNIETLIREEIDRMENTTHETPAQKEMQRMDNTNQEKLIREEMHRMEIENRQSGETAQMPKSASKESQNKEQTLISRDPKNIETNDATKPVTFFENNMVQPTLCPPKKNTPATPMQRIKPVTQSDKNMIQPTLHPPRASTAATNHAPTHRIKSVSFSDRISIIQPTEDTPLTNTPASNQIETQTTKSVTFSDRINTIQPPLHPPRTNSPIFNKREVNRNRPDIETRRRVSGHMFSDGAEGSRHTMRCAYSQRRSSAARFVPYTTIKPRSPMILHTMAMDAGVPGSRARPSFRIIQPSEEIVLNTPPVILMSLQPLQPIPQSTPAHSDLDAKKLGVFKFIRKQFSRLRKFVRGKLKRGTKVSHVDSS